MKALQDRLSNYSTSLMDNPSAGLDPIRAAATDRINRRYSQLPDQIGRNLAGRGYGSSGSFGNSLYKSAYARSGDLGDLESQLAGYTLAQRNQGASLGEQLLSLTRGQTATGTTPSTSLSDALQSTGSGLSNIATLLTLSKLLKPAATKPAGGLFANFLNPGPVPYSPAPIPSTLGGTGYSGFGGGGYGDYGDY